ncbi:DUF4349 domain-containing protein [Knoellia sp. CPCC 206435]|uniref:DUF4349 domain-containing protein n=1 Tax=Knoellia terrae TaxID=3404797 RepID=UPI003B42CD08
MSPSVLPRSAPRRRLATLFLVALLGLGSLAACSGGSEDSGSATGGSSGVDQSEVAPQPADGDRAGVVGDAKGEVAPDAVRAGAGDKLVRRASLQLKVDSLRGSAERIRAIATSQGGSVLSEELYASMGAGPDTSGSITITVPASSLESTIGLIEKVGDVQFRSSSSEDVTATYVDTEARVKSLTESVGRIRELLATAKSISDLVALENELSRRQAELDALTAQLANLKDSVAMSPISISLSTDDFEPVTAGGFLAGLRSGWSAFLTSLSVLATALGAVLPFALAGALVGIPVMVWWRRRRVGAVPALARPVGPPPSAG